MVDFQSRDRKRGLRRDDEDEDGAEPEAEAGAEPGSPEAEGADDQDEAVGGPDVGEQREHDHHAHDVEQIGAAVVTVSSSRSLDDDPAGDRIVRALEGAGDELVTRELVADSFDGVQRAVDSLASRGDVDIVVTTGGTGVTPDDVTIEAVRPLFDKELPGFGELFRSLSYQEIGSRIVATRATAGIVEGVPVFCLPGSENAARLGAEEIIVEEAGHLAGLASPEEDEE